MTFFMKTMKSAGRLTLSFAFFLIFQILFFFIYPSFMSDIETHTGFFIVDPFRPYMIQLILIALTFLSMIPVIIAWAIQTTKKNTKLSILQRSMEQNND
jgi:hypothetical protein